MSKRKTAGQRAFEAFCAAEFPSVCGANLHSLGFSYGALSLSETKAWEAAAKAVEDYVVATTSFVVEALVSH